jgi:hypothetical protein
MNKNIQGFETYLVPMHVGLYIRVRKQESKSVFPKKLTEDWIQAEFANIHGGMFCISYVTQTENVKEEPIMKRYY